MCYCTSTYEAQAKAVVSPDGTKVVFTSDWGVAGGEVNDYVTGQALNDGANSGTTIPLIRELRDAIVGK